MNKKLILMVVMVIVNCVHASDASKKRADGKQSVAAGAHSSVDASRSSLSAVVSAHAIHWLPTELSESDEKAMQEWLKSIQDSIYLKEQVWRNERNALAAARARQVSEQKQ